MVASYVNMLSKNQILNLFNKCANMLFWDHFLTQFNKFFIVLHSKHALTLALGGFALKTHLIVT